MSLVFIFSDEDDLKVQSKYQIYRSYFPLPEQITLLPDVWEQILKIAHAVGKLTQASLHITCKEVGLKDYFIKSAHPEGREKLSVQHAGYTMPIAFEGFEGWRTKTQVLRIFHPISVFAKSFRRYSARSKTLNGNLQLNFTSTEPKEQEALEEIEIIKVYCLSLLNQGVDPRQQWRYKGFMGYWADNTLAAIWKRHGKEQRQEERERKKREEKSAKEQARLEKKRQAALARGQALPITEGATGKRRAIPGKFKDVQMRSQLEIRFAAELELRAIRWQYELERLGESNYLVDFYLPDQKIWIEVKGKFEPRDELVLPEVAQYLKEMRSEGLYIYTQREVFLVTPEGFDRLIKDDFWGLLQKKK